MANFEDGKQFTQTMLMQAGVPAEKIKEDDPLFIWFAENGEYLLNKGATYGEAWAFLMTKLEQKWAAETEAAE